MAVFKSPDDVQATGEQPPLLVETRKTEVPWTPGISPRGVAENNGVNLPGPELRKGGIGLLASCSLVLGWRLSSSNAQFSVQVSCLECPLFSSAQLRGPAPFSTVQYSAVQYLGAPSSLPNDKLEIQDTVCMKPGTKGLSTPAQCCVSTWMLEGR